MPSARYQRFFLLLLVLTALLAWALFRPARQPAPSSPASLPEGAVTAELMAQLAALEEQERQIAGTVWAPELQAQQYALAFDELWDRLNQQGDPWSVLAQFQFQSIKVPQAFKTESLPHGIEVHVPNGAGKPWNFNEWMAFVSNAREEGWRYFQAEFRQVAFDPPRPGRPARSEFYFSAHLTNELDGRRAALEGPLRCVWPEEVEDGILQPYRLDASELIFKMGSHPPLFQRELIQEVAPFDKTPFIDPLILYDLDGDGFSEIILAARNLVFKRRPDGTYESRPLCRHPPGLIFTGIIADFDGDGAADFLCAKFEGLFLFKGSPQGTFDEPGRLVWKAEPRLRYAQVLSSGDINGNGHLDLWLGQYKVPYERGQMPTPYYDAMDGFPSHLLLNDGQGNFTDITEASGLMKQRRRFYSGSFLDLNENGHLDLALVSDFGGVELFLNDGQGRFTEITNDWIEENSGFGMAHSWADLDRDGRLDFLMIAMNSPTADRLNHLELVRPGYENYARMSGPMTYGNRLLLQRNQRFIQNQLSDSIARSGWSWGAAAFDLDNNGFLDVYIANGHETKMTVREYEPEFWLHDIYVGSSEDDILADLYFRSKISRLRGRGQSYGGYEKNRLYLNRQGERFVELGHLFGLALEQDSRNVVADDLDGDGRMDLLVTTFEAWPRPQQTLQIFRNQVPDGGNWIGFRLREEGHGFSPVGATIRVRLEERTLIHQIITGDGYRSQSANNAHFGLGQATTVRQAEIRWTNGEMLLIENPEINQWHQVRAR